MVLPRDVKSTRTRPEPNGAGRFRIDIHLIGDLRSAHKKQAEVQPAQSPIEIWSIPMNVLEIEVKFSLANPEPIRNRILALNADFVSRVDETNILFDTMDRKLRRADTILRLRQDDATRITVKTPPDVIDPEFKALRELETVVSDFDTTRAMFHVLGFTCEQVYEKRRETWTLPGVHFCLDEMPFGWFLELEGDRNTIRRTAAALGLVWEDRLKASYRAIFEALKQHHGYPFSDIRFADFKKAPIDIPAILPGLD